MAPAFLHLTHQVLERTAPAGKSTASAQAAGQACARPMSAATPARALRPSPLFQDPGWVPGWTFADRACPPPSATSPLLLVLTLPPCWEAPSGETVLVGLSIHSRRGQTRASSQRPQEGREALPFPTGLPGAKAQSPGNAGDHS